MVGKTKTAKIILIFHFKLISILSTKWYFWYFGQKINDRLNKQTNNMLLKHKTNKQTIQPWIDFVAVVLILSLALRDFFFWKRPHSHICLWISKIFKCVCVCVCACVWVYSLKLEHYSCSIHKCQKVNVYKYYLFP